MKIAVVSFGGYHFATSVENAIQFLSQTKQVDREYDGETGYHFHELVDKRRITEVEVRVVNELLPPKEEVQS